MNKINNLNIRLLRDNPQRDKIVDILLYSKYINRNPLYYNPRTNHVHYENQNKDSIIVDPVSYDRINQIIIYNMFTKEMFLNNMTKSDYYKIPFTRKYVNMYTHGMFQDDINNGIFKKVELNQIQEILNKLMPDPLFIYLLACVRSTNYVTRLITPLTYRFINDNEWLLEKIRK